MVVVLAVPLMWAARAEAQIGSVHDNPEHVACLQAASPECLFELALDNFHLGISEPSAELRNLMGRAQLDAGDFDDAIRTLAGIVEEMEASGGYRPPNPYMVDPHLALALAQHASGDRAGADASFAKAQVNTGPPRQGYHRDTYTASLLRLAIALADTGRVEAAEAALASAKASLGEARAKPYVDSIHGRRKAIKTLPKAIARVAAAQAAKGEYAAALATARQIGDAEHLRAAGLSGQSRPQSAAFSKSYEHASALAKVSVTLSGIAAVQLDRDDPAGAGQTLSKALEIIPELKDSHYGLMAALGAAAPVQARVGDLNAAFDAAERLRRLCCVNRRETWYFYPAQFAETLRKIAVALLAKGDVAAALDVAEKIDRPRERALVLAEVAAELVIENPARASQVLSEAESTVRQITFERARYEPLGRIAVIRAQLRETAPAHKLLEEALRFARHVYPGDVIYTGDSGPDSVGTSIRFVAAGMAKAGFLPRARELLDERCRSETGAARDIALIQIGRGDPDGAEHTLLECYRERSKWMTPRQRRAAGTEDAQPDAKLDHELPPALDAAAIAVLGRLAVEHAKDLDDHRARLTLMRASQVIARWERRPTVDATTRAAWVRATAEIAKAQWAIGEASSAKRSFARGMAGIRLIDRLRIRAMTGLYLAQALASAKRRDEALAALLDARRDAVELMNNQRAGWVGADSRQARSLLRSIAIRQAELGDVPGALQTAEAILDPSILPGAGGLALRIRLQRDIALRDIALVMIEVGRDEEALEAATDIASPIQQAIVLAAAAGAKPDPTSRSRRDLQIEARGLLERAPSSRITREATKSKAHAYAMLAKAQAATGALKGARASLSAGHDLARLAADIEDQVSILLALAEAEQALEDRALVERTLGAALKLADEGSRRGLRLDLYAGIARAQKKLLGREAAGETVRQVFSFYYTPVGGTRGTVSASIRFPTTIAVLMRELRIPRFDTTPFPSR